MGPTPVIEAPGDEIAKCAEKHPPERFQLIWVGSAEPQTCRGPGSERWEELMQLIHSMKGKSRSLPLDATITEALYD